MATIKRNYNKDGELISFRIRAYKGVDENGKQLPQHNKTVKIPPGMAPRKIERFIEEQKVLFEQQCKKGFNVDNKSTFRSYADYVLKLKQNQGLKTRTLSRYRELLVRINKKFGHIKVVDITPSMLNQFYAELAKDGQNKKTGGKLSPKTILEHHRLISTILAQAYKEMIVEHNPASRATPPKVIKKTPNYFQPDVLKRILKCADLEPIVWKTMIYLLIFTGCRRGEVAALKWHHVDFEHNMIYIDKELLYDSSVGVYEDNVKTEAGERFISLPSEIMQLLREYQQWQNGEREKYGDLWIDSDYVFTSDYGKHFHPDSITSHMNDFAKKYDLPHINPHAFRHSFSSVLIADNVDPVTLAATLGHSKVSHTTDIYSHLINEARNKTAKALSGALLK